MILSEAQALKKNMLATFESAHGKEVMKFIKRIGNYYCTVYDSGDTNEIIARDANRRLIQTLESIINLTPEQIVKLTEE